MSFEYFIARRYLASKHKINFITIISMISIVGITLGVAALIVVLSVFNGFGSLVTKFMMNYEPDLRVEIISKGGKSYREQLLKLLESDKEIKSFSPYVTGKVIAYNNGLTRVANLKGVDSKVAEQVYDFKSGIKYGNDNIASEGRIPKIILGMQLADKLQVITGDTLTLISPVGIEKAVTQFSMPLTRKVVITGIYVSNNNEYDASYMITNLPFTQFLLGYKNRIQGYEIRLKNSGDASDVKEVLQSKLPVNDFSVSTWYDFHQELYSVMKMERWIAYLILSLIIAVATFNILGSLSMSVIEKKRDIGILRAMGTSEKSILKIFMFEGILIGIIGTLLGAILGYLICYLQIKYNIYPLNPLQYKVDSLPLEIRLSDFFYISGVSLLLSFFASLYPAKRAAKVNPIQAIKWE
ncbi:lipoprotein-releasing system transmembrane protein LolC [bacterium BMS3Abin03]|nr:lipoprotein-releasing system transmembrane protein LolC [bacterium BMS3Abin03]